MRQTLKKGFTIAVSFMTAFWSVGVAAFAPITAAAATGAAVAEGDLVKGSLAGVYYVGANGKRYVFPNSNTYDTWFADFSTVKTLSDSELAAIPLGGNVTYRPSARLIKIQTDPKVYMVGANGSLHPIPDEATALAFFGSTWSSLIDDVPDTFFTNYTVSTDAVATALGMGGKLPTGTVVKEGANTYLVGDTALFMAAGSVSMLDAAVVAADATALTSLVGTVPSSPTSMNIDDVARPDRSGSLESGTGGSTPGTSGSLSVTVKSSATNIAMASTASQNMGVSTVDFCSDSGTASITSVKLSAAKGTVTFNDMIIYMVLGGLLYESGGTFNGDTGVELTATDEDATVAGGCSEGQIFHATSQTGGKVNLELTDVLYTTTGTAAASTLAVNKSVAVRDANPVNSADLTDLSFSSPLPAGGSTLQTDGTKQKLFGVSAAISNNDMLIPMMVFKINGTIDTSSCELRVNGAVVSTTYTWAGKYLKFELPADKQLFDQGTDTWEVWCNINGEAGQSVTPQIVWPAPGFHLYDNVRVKSAALMSDKELVAPNLSRLSSSVTSALTLAGASAIMEAINVNSVVGQDDEKTSGATNTIMAAFRIKIRGSKATLSNIVYTTSGTHAAKGFALCQIKIGPRTDNGEISLTSVDLSDYQLSNYGSETNVTSAGNNTTTANKQLPVGDHLAVWECDAVTAGAAYGNGDVAAIAVQVGTTNISFDVGTSANFPTSVATGTTITLRLLTALAIAADVTGRNLVQNGTDQVIGVYTITGPTQEGVDITSLGITFVTNVAGTTGCTTVTLKDASGTEIATSQSLTAAGTLTFSVTFNVAKNTEFILNVVCLQASSAVTPYSAGASQTTLANISGTGDSSAQSFTATPATVGSTVVIIAKGTVTAAQGTNGNNQMIGPGEQLLVMTMTMTASIHEDQYVKTLNFNNTINGAASATFLVNELTKVTIKAEGFTVAGTAGAAETTICERTVTGVTVTCGYSNGDVTLGAGQTGTLTYYVTGHSVGNIGKGTTVVADFTTPGLNDQTDILMEGVQSQGAIADGSSSALTGRVVTPSGATVRVVNQSPTSRVESGKLGMEQGLMDVIVGGSNITWTLLSGTCYGVAANGVCDSADDTIDIILDGSTNVVTAAALAAGTASTGPYTSGALTTLLTAGTHSLKLLYNDIATTNGLCSASGETVQFGTDGFGFTIGGLVFTSTQTPLIADFSSATGNEIKHVNTTCG